MNSSIRRILCAILFACLWAGGCASVDPNATSFRSDRHGVFGTLEHAERTETVETDVYLAPGTRMEITRSRPVAVRPSYILYDRRHDRYIGVAPDGRRYLLDGPWENVPIIRRDTVRFQAPDDRPGAIRSTRRKRSARTGGNFGVEPR